jgi:glucosamine-6-phosphate deaminase
MMDDYVGASPDAHYSCAEFARREIAGPLGVSEDRVWLPDPADPAAYDERIDTAGGIDTFLLASGASDSHVAFLPPGSPLGGRTAVVQLAESTRRDNLVTFPDFRSLDEVPRGGVSVGLRTITKARAPRLVLHVRDKRTAATRTLAYDGFEPGWPATVVHDHVEGEIWIDREAVP